MKNNKIYLKFYSIIIFSQLSCSCVVKAHISWKSIFFMLFQKSFVIFLNDISWTFGGCHSLETFLIRIFFNCKHIFIASQTFDGLFTDCSHCLCIVLIGNQQYDFFDFIFQKSYGSLYIDLFCFFCQILLNQTDFFVNFNFFLFKLFSI